MKTLCTSNYKTKARTDMQKKKIVTVEPGTVPEVIEFLDAQGTLEDFKQEHVVVFKMLEELVDRYNTALEQADKVCRANQVSCGPFDLYQFSTKYDAEALYNAVGRDKFLEVGGKIETQTVYDLDKGRLEACVAQKKVPEDVLTHVRKETPSYHKPAKLVVP